MDSLFVFIAKTANVRSVDQAAKLFALLGLVAALVAHATSGNVLLGDCIEASEILASSFLANSDLAAADAVDGRMERDALTTKRGAWLFVRLPAALHTPVVVVGSTIGPSGLDH